MVLLYLQKLKLVLDLKTPFEMYLQIVPSPMISANGPGDEKLFRSQSAEMELSTERERVKKMLSEG